MLKNRIFMYLFFFALLFVIFQYMNEKTIFESQEKKITSLTEKKMIGLDSIAGLNDRIVDLNYFTLQGNESAMIYFEKLGLDPLKVEQQVSDVIYDRISENGGNSLIPFAGTNGTMKINKLKFLNHRWLIADFSDGSSWGEMIVEYFFDDKMELQFSVIGSVLYPN
jgi:hypothetical protein